jgi:transposase-like protein
MDRIEVTSSVERRRRWSAAEKARLVRAIHNPGADKARLLAQLRAAIATPELAPLRPAWARGL